MAPCGWRRGVALNLAAILIILVILCFLLLGISQKFRKFNMISGNIWVAMGNGLQQVPGTGGFGRAVGERWDFSAKLFWYTGKKDVQRCRARKPVLGNEYFLPKSLVSFSERARNPPGSNSSENVGWESVRRVRGGERSEKVKEGASPGCSGLLVGCFHPAQH